MNIHYYRCYSINLYRFLKACNHTSINNFTDGRTNRRCWVFELDTRLQESLKKYSKGRVQTNESKKIN